MATIYLNQFNVRFNINYPEENFKPFLCLGWHQKCLEPKSWLHPKFFNWAGDPLDFIVSSLYFHFDYNIKFYICGPYSRWLCRVREGRCPVTINMLRRTGPISTSVCTWKRIYVRPFPLFHRSVFPFSLRSVCYISCVFAAKAHINHVMIIFSGGKRRSICPFIHISNLSIYFW